MLLSPPPHPRSNPFLPSRDFTAIIKLPHQPADQVHLLLFWPTRSAGWFGAANATFLLRRVTDQQDKFPYIIAVLGKDQLIQVADLLEVCPPPLDAFDHLRQWLIQTHFFSENPERVPATGSALRHFAAGRPAPLRASSQAAAALPCQGG